MISFSKRFFGGVAPEYFCKNLKERGTSAYFGVPDRGLASFAAYAGKIADTHIVASNEGSAVSMASGHYMATGEIPLVYFSNTGIGNATSALLSVAHRQADHIPLLMLISWRGMPDTDDYPQHGQIGLHTQNLLTVLGIPFSILFPSDDPEFNTELVLDKAFNQLHANKCPFAILAERSSFEDFFNPIPLQRNTPPSLSRREAVDHVLSCLPLDIVVVGGPGGISKDIAASRIKANAGKGTADYLAIGSREHCSSIAEGIAMSTPSKQVLCLELGCGINQFSGPPHAINLKRIIFQDSGKSSFPVASALGYSTPATKAVTTKEEIESEIKALLSAPGAAIMEVLVNEGGGGDTVIKYNGAVIQGALQTSTS